MRSGQCTPDRAHTAAEPRAGARDMLPCTRQLALTNHLVPAGLEQPTVMHSGTEVSSQQSLLGVSTWCGEATGLLQC